MQYNYKKRCSSLKQQFFRRLQNLERDSATMTIPFTHFDENHQLVRYIMTLSVQQYNIQCMIRFQGQLTLTTKCGALFVCQDGRELSWKSIQSQTTNIAYLLTPVIKPNSCSMSADEILALAVVRSSCLFLSVFDSDIFKRIT